MRHAVLGIALVLVALGSGAVAEERTYPTLILDEEQWDNPIGMIRSVVRANGCQARVDLHVKAKANDEWLLGQTMFLDLDTVNFDRCLSSTDLPPDEIHSDLFSCPLIGIDKDRFDRFRSKVFNEAAPIEPPSEKHKIIS